MEFSNDIALLQEISWESGLAGQEWNKRWNKCCMRWKDEYCVG